MIIGYDGGMKGGISLIEDDGRIIYSIPFPVIKGGKGTRSQYDIKKIVDLLIEAKNKDPNLFAVLEHAQVTPLAGKVSSFMMGYYLGMIQGILEAQKVSYQVVKAKKWQSVILNGMPGDTKAKSILWCQRKYPDFDWKETPRCKIQHDGKTDSCCIANYGKLIR